MPAMSTVPDDLERRIRELTRDQKIDLVRTLIGELDATAEGKAETLWLAEARERYSRYLAGELDAIPASEVIARVRSRLA